MTLFTHRIQQYDVEIASLHQKINALQSEQDKLRKNENNAASALKVLEDVVQEFGDDGEVMQSLKEKLETLFTATTDGESEIDNLPSNKFQEYHSTLRFQSQNEADLFGNEARKRGICNNFESFSDGSLYVFGVSDEDALNRLINDKKSAKIDVPEAEPTATTSRANSELLHAHPMIFFDAHADSMRLFLFTKDHAVATYEKAKEAGLAKQHELHKLKDTWLLVLSPVNRDTAFKIKELAVEKSSPTAIATAPQIAIEPPPQSETKAIAANPIQPISELPLLTETECHQLLVEWNNTTKEYPQDKCIHQLFEEQVELTPNAVAVVFKNQQLTYRELNTKANQLAHYLQTLGVKPEVLVGICIERSLEMIIGLLGILKAGGAYVPIDTAYPSERIAYMLDDSQLPVLLTQQKLVTSLPKHQAQVVICLDSDWEEISKGSKVAPQSGVTLENLAYIIYTSGSTGKPKGVLIPHSGVLNLVFWHQHAFEVTLSDRATQLAGTAFDASVWEIWPYLASGASIYLVKPEILLSPGELRDWLLTQEITITFVPTPIAEKLLSLQWPCDGALRIMLTGGDKLHQYPSASIPFKIVNNYGPTENTVVTTSGLVVCDRTDNTLPHIGRPIDNTQVYILDRYLQPVPIGVPGELHIAGVGLARGYLNQLDLTQQKFILNPFSNEPGERLYKTGDLARYLSDGNIEYIGRIDNQVKIRGFRIELGEIETAISQHQSVKQTVVIATENNIGNKQLAAYIVPKPQAAPTSSDLRNFLKQILPDYMIPATFIMLETLPLTPNGKIDTKALPKPYSAHQQRATTKVPPQTATQKILASIWAEVLQLQEVGIHDNFFELGGDSIISIQIVARCHQANLHLTVKDLFQHQTIAGLAQIVTTTKEIKTEQGLVTGIVPLTPILHWFTSQNLPEPHHFNQSFLFEISPDVKPEILRQVFQQLLLHHDALRLRLILNGDTWQLINAPAEESEIFSIIDLSKIGQSEQITAIEATANQLQASLNLSDSPIIRVALFHLGNQQANRLLIIIHHLAVDGISWRILLEDLSVAYQQLSQDKTIQLPAKTTSFQDWGIRLTEYAQTQTAVAELDYWLTQLNSQITPLPVDYPAEIGENKIYDTSAVSVSIF
ncbi:amino acid adenylation domain-containing protein [Limnoraphis robusta Tam1]|uniref:Amino acid adenylation domain-containing protein n=1 Tax=Limnoraphis robusta CCNP1315 TaxID=3110306 RepID=A0ABU5U5C1_9CYAN|nr:amino acid adenylation domain-containing protein [Limnoraphis robusta]MEA5498289.1 amino acid adenylation domain-containing protein [Limnoraphis robusta BA-68 BA1]MEA5521353.1 amino acid adenylation domain-containing protein [Limnoraphis robusta CCNP1315]MEA5540312.1 amino acid adenylation domain-containing protein [Limnoraphis robusta Tam1]MEA5547970.1 amino acid adenylation domain-containing protein [Limnoraphis robusta CCNP1324]